MMFPDKDRPSIERRLLSKCTFEPNTGCWLWLGSLNNKGYGEIMLRHTRRTAYAHRVSYFLYRGTAIVGKESRHTCDVSCCINPFHVIPGTHLENMHDMVVRCRSRLGTTCPAVQKVTDTEVMAIRVDVRSGTVIAAEYGISRQHVNAIRRGACRVSAHV